MSASAPSVEFDPERTGMDESGPTTVRDTGRPGRGSVIAGKYRLEMLLGEGGMACVWSAYNTELELPVAIKLLRAGLTSEALAQRLRNEARAIARLVHPSIVRVFDVAVTESGEPFIVMELLTGETLAEELRRGPMQSVRAVQLMLPIAEALSFAHAHGIVHRDVKPDNVLLSTEGDSLQPKLLDFGIAKLARGAAALVKLTERGTTLGSPNYMSPEQVCGEDVDYRTDIWSFCVVLYKALAGVAPFHGADKRETLEAIVSAEPRPLTLAAGVDEQLARLIHWGLAKDPAQRPLSMRVLAQELSRWLCAQGISSEAAGAAAPEPAPRLTSRSSEALVVRREPPSAPAREPYTQRIVPMRRRSWAPLAVLAVLLASGSVVWASSSSSESEGVERPVPPPRPLPTEPMSLPAQDPPVPTEELPRGALEPEPLRSPTVDVRDEPPPAAPRERGHRRGFSGRQQPASKLPF